MATILFTVEYYNLENNQLNGQEDKLRNYLTKGGTKPPGNCWDVSESDREEDVEDEQP